MSPPGPNALPGYQLTYTSNFSGSSPLAGWDEFSGTPGGDPGGLWAASQVAVSGGVLELNAADNGGQWVTGGLCQCGVAKTYGAYFVRSRLTGAGPSSDELLWPAGPDWPPEVDFNETFGGDTSSLATVHYTAANLEEHSQLDIDMTQWHTWGVIWTPTSITYTVDGQEWGEVTNAAEIPSQPMTLDIQQQTFCESGWACPTTPESVLVNWVAEYSSVSADSFTVGTFAQNSSSLSPRLKKQIRSLAEQIKTAGYNLVNLKGFGDDSGTNAKRLATSRARANNVHQYLLLQLDSLGVTGVVITTASSSGSLSSQDTAMPEYRRVVALLSKAGE
jgi:outer membrane protein OmpA-like peptidoglycan-associated protein